MARQTTKVTIGQVLGEGRYNASAAVVGGALDTTTAVADTATADTALALVVGADQTAVESAVALLETDGALPTQAHVNALRTVWNTLKTDAATAKAATVVAKADLVSLAAALVGDVVITWNTATVTKVNQLRRAFEQALQAVLGSGTLT